LLVLPLLVLIRIALVVPASALLLFVQSMKLPLTVTEPPVVVP